MNTFLDCLTCLNCSQCRITRLKSKISIHKQLKKVPKGRFMEVAMCYRDGIRKCRWFSVLKRAIHNEKI